MNDSQADLILKKARRALQPRRLPEKFNAAAPSSDEMTDERLLSAYEALASIISVHGDQYLPLFKRLHAEIEDRKKNDDYVKMARDIHNQTIEP